MAINRIHHVQNSLTNNLKFVDYEKIFYDSADAIGNGIICLWKQ